MAFLIKPIFPCELYQSCTTASDQLVRSMPSGVKSAITFQGRTQSIVEWAKEIGITAEGLRGRISKLGAEAALAGGAAHMPRSTRDMVTHDGRTQSRADWAKELGLSKSGLTNRINTLGVERAISVPSVQSLRP